MAECFIVNFKDLTDKKKNPHFRLDANFAEKLGRKVKSR